MRGGASPVIFHIITRGGAFLNVILVFPRVYKYSLSPFNFAVLQALNTPLCTQPVSYRNPSDQPSSD
jgi:hypothetical protein